MLSLASLVHINASEVHLKLGIHGYPSSGRSKRGGIALKIYIYIYIYIYKIYKINL